MEKKTATFTIGVRTSGVFTGTVDLVAVSPSPGLILDLYPQTIDPPGQATLTLTDMHTAAPAPGLWYTVPVTASANGIPQTTSVSLLLGGVRVFLPVVLAARDF